MNITKIATDALIAAAEVRDEATGELWIVSRRPSEANWNIDAYAKGGSFYWNMPVGARRGMPRIMASAHPAQALLASL